MSEPKTHHIWMPDGRSLCDRRALTPVSDPVEYVDDITTNPPPVCGACLLVAGRIRHEACALLEANENRVHPEKPTEAWASLKGTRWERQVDLEEFLARPGLDKDIDFKAIRYAMDPATVAEQATAIRANHAAFVEYAEQVRQQSGNGADEWVVDTDAENAASAAAVRARHEAARAVPCAKCGVHAGETCRTANGIRAEVPHSTRIKAGVAALTRG